MLYLSSNWYDHLNLSNLWEILGLLDDGYLSFFLKLDCLPPWDQQKVHNFEDTDES